MQNQLKLNKERIKKAHISRMQTEYDEYKKALIKQLQATSISDDGNICIWDGLFEKTAAKYNAFVEACEAYHKWLDEEENVVIE